LEGGREMEKMRRKYIQRNVGNKGPRGVQQVRKEEKKGQ
jgi:hypothetical protein